MIDLRNKDLPNTVKVNGRFYSIETDFRVWLRFGEICKKKTVYLKEISFVFKNEVPGCDFSKELFEFYSNPNATPKGEASDEVLFDYILDGEYIYASFMQAYGIDLFDVDMHWHKFKSLFLSLPQDCKMVQIMQDRGYKEDKRKYEEIARQRKYEWSLPREEVDEEIIEGLKTDFYGAM